MIKVNVKVYEENKRTYVEIEDSKYIKYGKTLYIANKTVEDLKGKDFYLGYKVEISEQEYNRHGEFEYIPEHDETVYLENTEDEEVLKEAYSLVEDIDFTNDLANKTNRVYTLLMALVVDNEDLTLLSDSVIEPKISFVKTSIITDFEDYLKASREEYEIARLNKEDLEYAIEYGYVNNLSQEEIYDCLLKISYLDDIKELAIKNDCQLIIDKIEKLEK